MIDYTPAGMAHALETARDRVEVFLRKSKIAPTDARYCLGALENAIEVCRFISEHEVAITKMARGNVPWRRSAK